MPRLQTPPRGLLLAAAMMLAGLASTPHAVAEANSDSTFLRQMAADPAVKTLPSGLEYKVLQSGDPQGSPPAIGDELVLNYEGKLADGAVFDSTERQGGMARIPFDGLIPGWMEGLKLMRPGDIWMLYIPSRLGYGAKGQGPIPPDAPLVFKIELVAVHRAGG